MNNLTFWEFFLGIFSGVLVGTLPNFIQNWHVKFSGKQTLSKALMIESASHRASLYLLLDENKDKWPNGPFNEQFPTPMYSLVIYEANIAKLDSLINPDMGAQVHLYYQMIKGLNKMVQDKKDDASPGNEFKKNYLNSAIHAYSYLFGLQQILSGDSRGRAILRDSVKPLFEYDHPDNLFYWDADLFQKYKFYSAATESDRIHNKCIITRAINKIRRIL